MKNRIRHPLENLSVYCTIDRNGEPVDVQDLTKEELQHELCRSYDVLNAVRDAMDEGTFKEFLEAMDKVVRFMSPPEALVPKASYAISERRRKP